MAGVTYLQRIQIGRETSDFGTAVAATTALRLNGTIEDTRTVVWPVERLGYLSGRDRVRFDAYSSKINLTGDATFEQLPYIFEMGIQTSSDNPTTDTGSSNVWTYTFPTTAQLAIQPYTIEGGDNTAAEEASYFYTNDFTLSGRYGEVWQLNANLIGGQITDTDTFTPSSDLTTPEVEEMLFQMSKLYIDNDSDTIGTTQATNTFLAAELRVQTGWRPVYTGDGSMDFSFLKNTGPEILLDVTFEHDATAVSEKTAWRNKTARLIRITCDGTALSTTDTYSTKQMIIDLAGKWEKFDKVDEIDGNDVVKGTFRARFNATSGLFAQIKIINELATLP